MVQPAQSSPLKIADYLGIASGVLVAASVAAGAVMVVQKIFNAYNQKAIVQPSPVAQQETSKVVAVKKEGLTPFTKTEKVKRAIGRLFTLRTVRKDEQLGTHTDLGYLEREYRTAAIATLKGWGWDLEAGKALEKKGWGQKWKESDRTVLVKVIGSLYAFDEIDLMVSLDRFIKENKIPGIKNLVVPIQAPVELQK